MTDNTGKQGQTKKTFKHATIRPKSTAYLGLGQHVSSPPNSLNFEQAQKTQKTKVIDVDKEIKQGLLVEVPTIHPMTSIQEEQNVDLDPAIDTLVESLQSFLDKEDLATSESKKIETALVEQTSRLSLQNEDAVKAAFIQSKIEPADPKEKARLEHRLAPTYIEKKRKIQITREKKLEAYIQELSREFDEQQKLKAEENAIVSDYVKENVARKPLEPLYRFESAASIEARKPSVYAKRQQKMETEGREGILLEALRQKIRENPQAMSPEGEKSLDLEEKAQAIVSPLYQKRITERQEELKTLAAKRQSDRYWRPEPACPKRSIANDAPGLDAAIGVHYRAHLLKNELKKPTKVTEISKEKKKEFRDLCVENMNASDQASRDNKNITNGRNLDHRTKPFRPLV